MEGRRIGGEIRVGGPVEGGVWRECRREIEGRGRSGSSSRWMMDFCWAGRKGGMVMGGGRERLELARDDIEAVSLCKTPVVSQGIPPCPVSLTSGGIVLSLSLERPILANSSSL